MSTGVARAREVVAQLLAEHGCAWHRELTHASLTRYLTEEAAETVHAIDSGQPAAAVAEELGDVLYQVLLHAELAARDGEGYDLDAVGEQLADKLIARHPHVFGDMGPKTAAELTAMWQQLKAQARAQQPRPGEDSPQQQSAGHPQDQPAAAAGQLFAGIAPAMPTLAKAVKMTERAHIAGVDPLLLISGTEISGAADAVGAELYEVIARATKEGVDADAALRHTLLRIAAAQQHG